MTPRLFDAKLVQSLHANRLLPGLVDALVQARSSDTEMLARAGDWSTCRFLQGRIHALDDVLRSLTPPTQGN